MFLFYAGTFYFAAWLISTGRLDAANFSDIFKVLFAIMVTAMTMGEDAALAPDMGEAKTAATRIIKMLNKKVKNQLYIGCCKLENDILKEAKNAQK